MNLKEEQGYTMVVVMVTVVILSLMITAVTTLAWSDVRKSKLWRDKTSAFYLAESGINDAIFGIINGDINITGLSYHYTSIENKDLNPTRYDFGSDNNYYEVWVEKADPVIKITSKGVWNKITKVVKQELELPALFPSPPTEREVIETCPLSANEYPIDYVANYVPPEISVTMPAGSPEGILDVGNGVTISGDHYYTDIDFSKNGKTLTIDGPANIYVANSVTVENNCQIITRNGDVTLTFGNDLIFDSNTKLKSSGGQVKIYVKKKATFNGDYYGNSSGETITLNRDPTKLLLYLETVPVPEDPTTNPPSGYVVTLGNNTNYVGGIFAPSANVQLNNGSETQGAVIGWEVLWGESGNKPDHADVTYDSSMATIPYTGGTWTLKGWSEQ